MERRLAAIFAADVVGYSRLMEADEEGTLATLNAYRQVSEFQFANVCFRAESRPRGAARLMSAFSQKPTYRGFSPRIDSSPELR